MTGAPREAYASQDFIIVSKAAVRALGGSWEAAGAFQRIAWRAERDGHWTASMEEIAEEIGVSVRTAKRVTKRLRDLGWVTAERANPYDSTLTWRAVFATGAETPGTPPASNETAGQPRECQVGTPESANVAPAGSAKLALPESAKLALPSTQTVETLETPIHVAADAATRDEPATKRDLNEGREDVDRVCLHLSQKLTEREIKHDHESKRWRDAARLAMDADGHTERQLHNMIEWCQNHHFWRSVIHSTANLREKYDQMKDQATGRTSDNVHQIPRPPSDPVNRSRIAGGLSG